MKLTGVQCIYFSPCGSVRKLAVAVAQEAARAANLPLSVLDLTLPESRKTALAFSPGSLTIAAFPVYAGRLPNRLLGDLQRIFSHGCGPAVPLVVYGNRSYGDALRELCVLLEQNGFAVVAGAALVAQHAFADTLAAGRPNTEDLAAAAAFGKMLPTLAQIGAPVSLPGNDPIGPYYQPKGLDGQPAMFLKAKPITDPSRCTGCGACVNACPVAAIDPADPTAVPGVCIKCQACIKICPHAAKYWEDPAFLSHKAALERDFTAPKEAAFFPPPSPIGRWVHVTVDRPLGSTHPKHPQMMYPVNYGFIPGTLAPDGEEQDAYILGVDTPVETFVGRVIAVIRRDEDPEEKWVIAPDGMSFSKEEILAKTRFQEQFFTVTVML